MSNEQKKYLNKIKKNKIFIITFQILIFITFIITWQILANYNIINTFIFSSPKKIITTLINLHNQNNLYQHITTTMIETTISFSLATILGLLIAIIMWYNKTLAKITEPYLTVLNSLPKVALGPMIIIIIGANTKSIIIMALLISLIITIINLYQGFIITDKNKIKLLKSLKATKKQILTKLILPSNISNIISVLKINISMSLIGVIMGEMLVAKKGIGYLIIYGSQIFNLNLVITGIILLATISIIMYSFIHLLENKMKKTKYH